MSKVTLVQIFGAPEDREGPLAPHERLCEGEARRASDKNADCVFHPGGVILSPGEWFCSDCGLTTTRLNGGRDG